MKITIHASFWKFTGQISLIFERKLYSLIWSTSLEKLWQFCVFYYTWEEFPGAIYNLHDRDWCIFHNENCKSFYGATHMLSPYFSIGLCVHEKKQIFTGQWYHSSFFCVQINGLLDFIESKLSLGNMNVWPNAGVSEWPHFHNWYRTPED